MERINKIVSLKNNTKHFNQTPNSNLKSPEISPYVLGKNEKEFYVFVTVPPYQYMATGNFISINIGELISSEPYTEKDYDIGNSILFILTQEEIKFDETETEYSLPISYSVSNDNYIDSNLSENGTISIVESINNSLPSPSLDLNLDYFDSVPSILNIYSNVIKIPDFNDRESLGKLNLYMMVETDLLYRSQISLYEGRLATTQILLKKSVLAPYPNKKLTVWYRASLQGVEDSLYVGSVISEITAPLIMYHYPLEILDRDDFLKALSSDLGYSMNSLNVILKKYPQMKEDKVNIYIYRYSDMSKPKPDRDGIEFSFNIDENKIGDDIVVPLATIVFIKSKFPSSGDLCLFYEIDNGYGPSIFGEYTVIPY